MIQAVSDEDIEAAFAPYVVEQFEPDDPRWQEARRRMAQKAGRPRVPRPTWLSADGERTTALVQSAYDEKWGQVELQEELQAKKVTWFEWRNRGMRARSLGRKRVFQLFFTRVLESLRPESVSEVGFGWGLNLLTLSMQFPDVRFGGVELTEGGVRTAGALARDPRTPDLLSGFLVTSLRDRSAPTRLDLRQGSAEALPLADKSVDMVITVLALEQMERIRDAALRELARVARRHVVMIEPFRDWNAEGHHREYIRRYDYWSAAVGDLPAFGLNPVMTRVDMPQKLAFRAGIVVTDVATR